MPKGVEHLVRNNSGGDRNRYGVDVCTGPVGYKGHAAVRTDIENLETALKGLRHEEVFVPADADAATMEKLRQQLEVNLNEATRRAYARVGRPEQA